MNIDSVRFVTLQPRLSHVNNRVRDRLVAPKLASNVDRPHSALHPMTNRTASGASRQRDFVQSA